MEAHAVRKAEGLRFSLNADMCMLCGSCEAVCPHLAINVTSTQLEHDKDRCKGCGACRDACPTGALA